MMNSQVINLKDYVAVFWACEQFENFLIAL